MKAMSPETSQAGADPGFSFRGGGGQKIMYPHAHYERGTELTFGRDPGARVFFPVPQLRQLAVLRVWNKTTTFLRLGLFSKSHLNLIKNIKMIMINDIVINTNML